MKYFAVCDTPIGSIDYICYSAKNITEAKSIHDEWIAFKKLWEVLEDSPFTGLGDAVFRGKNKGFFHADIRPGGRVVFAY